MMYKFNSRINNLREHIEGVIKEESHIIALYVFGSFMKRGLKEIRDLDLAFLLKNKEYNLNPLKTIYPAYSIAAQIGIKLDMKTDVTILNTSSLEIAYEILTTGQCIYETDPDVRVEYESALRGMYFDFKPFLLTLRSGCLNQL